VPRKYIENGSEKSDANGKEYGILQRKRLQTMRIDRIERAFTVF
jgi:hypothetical protein